MISRRHRHRPRHTSPIILRLCLTFARPFSKMPVRRDIRMRGFLGCLVYPFDNALIVAIQENPKAVDVLIELGADIHDPRLLISSCCTESTTVSLLQAGASGLPILTYGYAIRRMISDKWADSTIRMVFDSVPKDTFLPTSSLDIGLDYASMHGRTLLARLLIDRGATVSVQTIKYARDGGNTELAIVLNEWSLSHFWDS